MRIEHDAYYTPQQVLEDARELFADDLSMGLPLLDPFAGDGRVLRTFGGEGVALGYEIRDGTARGVLHGTDALRMPPPEGWVVITNPPYSLAFEAAQWCAAAEAAWLLLPLGFLASSKRRQWLQTHPPLVCPLARRPRFAGSGTAPQDYAWVRWSKDGRSGLDLRLR
jgi:hypothetical protein